MTAPLSRVTVRDRRGALLLLVLTSLTFFMMIGTLMLITATRTRTAARAFSDAANSSATGSIQSRAILDEALLLLLRGRKDDAGLPAPMLGQSILEDMYGIEAISGQASPPVRLTESRGLALFTNYAPILTTTLTNLTPAPQHCCDLNGRVLTFKPAAGDGDVASYRIIRTTKSQNTLTAYLANMPQNRSTVLPRQTSDVVINGREFCPSQSSPRTEAHDSFDADPWLARLQLQASKVVAVPQPSFAPAANAPAQCDNDNDGVPDGIWISGSTGFFPDRPSPLGGVLKHDLSYLVVDLDSRINLNAHGSLTPVVTGSADWPATFNTPSGSVVTMSGIPSGLGYGTADVSASRIVATGAAGGVPGFPGRWSNVCQAGNAVQQGAGSNTQRRPSPQVGQGTTAVDGRYGADAGGKRVPGVANSVVAPLLQCGLSGSVTVGGVTRLIGNSPTDLNVRVRMFNGPSTAGVPTIYFYTPTRTTNDFLESPYQLRLDTDAPRGQELRRPSAKANNPTTDNPFTLAELERLLRQLDPDASTLPPRLAAILDDYAERSRNTVTTDSWDTPAMAGQAMTKVRDYMRTFAEPAVPVDSLARGNKAANVYDALSPDVSVGLRFDINRPLDHPAVAASLVPAIEERFCRHVYTLLVALGQPANQQTAQWAANVCDFRDPDSTMTRFRYDTNPADGWDVDDNVDVFGAERPEVVITETVAYPGYLAVVLYHPWDAKVVDKDTPGDSTKYIQVETVDKNLTDNPGAAVSNNVLDLGAKVTNDSVWRIRVVGGATVNLADLTAGGAAAKLKLDDRANNQYVCLQTTNGNNNVGNSVRSSALVPGAVGPGEVVLERLADPTKKWNGTKTNADHNPYIVVDRATIQVGADATTFVRQRRSSATFWKQAWEAAGATPTDTIKTAAPWFHWPNRPFVSVAELALVPTGDASGMLAVGAAASPAANPASLILDACHVPSRFDGTSVRIGGDSLLSTTAQYESVCSTMLPRWREPGRVNVNTIPANTGNTPAELDNAVWQATVGAGAGATIASSPFATGNAGNAADSFTKMLSLKAAGGAMHADPAAAPRDLDPFFQNATAIRLANVGTIRSNVFAVWITLRITDTSASAPSPVYRRLFAIVDRTIPVGFNKGENLNVRDTIRVLRFLD